MFVFLFTIIVATFLTSSLYPFRLRRDGRSNGTAILRRSSTTPFHNQAAPNAAASTLDNSLAAAVHDLTAPSSADPTMAKYTREELLEMSRDTAVPQWSLRNILMENFNPDAHVNGNSARGWGKPSDAISHNDPAICWDNDGHSGPLGYQEMSPEEREVRILSPPPGPFSRKKTTKTSL